MMFLQESLGCNDFQASVNKTGQIENFEEECDQTCQQTIGIVFVLVSQVLCDTYHMLEHVDIFYLFSVVQFFAALMYVYREKVLKKHNIHPFKAAGLEGT